MSGCSFGSGGNEILGAAGAVVTLNRGRLILAGALVDTVLIVPKRSRSVTRSFGEVRVANADFPAMAAFPPSEASAADRGAPTICSSAGAGVGLSGAAAATTGSSEDGAGAATVGSVDDAAL